MLALALTTPMLSASAAATVAGAGAGARATPLSRSALLDDGVGAARCDVPRHRSGRSRHAFGGRRRYGDGGQDRRAGERGEAAPEIQRDRGRGGDLDGQADPEAGQDGAGSARSRRTRPCARPATRTPRCGGRLRTWSNCPCRRGRRLSRRRRRSPSSTAASTRRRSADFGSRVVASVNVSSRAPSATGDQQGHGTMVAGIAAGASALYPGGAPNAQLVDVRTADGNGESLASDVIAGIDWILAHKAQYGIRVVNLSMVGDTQTSFLSDPLNKAVERLWFSGIVVVAAAGNNGTEYGRGRHVGRARERSVRDHGRRDRPGADLGDRRRLRRSVVRRTATPWTASRSRSLSAPGRYLVDAGTSRRRRSPRRCPTAPSRRATCGCPVRRSRLRSSPALGRPAAGPPPELDAGSGEGCADADGARTDSAGGIREPPNSRRIRGSRRLDRDEHRPHDSERRPRLEPRHLCYRLPARPHERRCAERGQSCGGASEGGPDRCL